MILALLIANTYHLQLCRLDERELRKFLDELQTKRSAHEAEARRKADPHKDMLEKLLGRSVKLEGDPYATSRSAPSGRIPEVSNSACCLFSDSGGTTPREQC